MRALGGARPLEKSDKTRFAASRSSRVACIISLIVNEELIEEGTYGPVEWPDGEERFGLGRRRSFIIR